MKLSLEEEYQPTADILQEEKLLIGLSYQGGIVNDQNGSDFYHSKGTTISLPKLPIPPEKACPSFELPNQKNSTASELLF